MKIRTMNYYMAEAFTSFRRNSFMSIASIATVALALFILGLFSMLAANLDYFADNLENQVELSVYLKDDLTTDQVMAVGRQLKELPDVKEIAFNNPESVKSAAVSVKDIKGVESTHYGQDIIEQLFKIANVIRWGGVVLIVFLAFATLFIISNTIRLTVFARRKEIGIMKYVGATNWFIRWPFLLEGLLLGFIGGLIADIALFQFYEFVTVSIHESLAFLPLVSFFPFMYQLAGGLLVISMIIGAIGSTISLKRYMKV